jgi:hypothetical protein
MKSWTPSSEFLLQFYFAPKWKLCLKKYLILSVSVFFFYEESIIINFDSFKLIPCSNFRIWYFFYLIKYFLFKKGNAKGGVSPRLKIWPSDLDLWPWKSIGFQILLRTKYVPSLVKINLYHVTSLWTLESTSFNGFWPNLVHT